MTTTTPTVTPDGAKNAVQPVDRSRRFRFIGSVVAFSLVSAAAFTGLVAWVGVAAISLPIIEMYIGGMMSLAMAASLAYLGGSVVDYNGGVANIFTVNRSSSVSDYAIPDNASVYSENGARG